MAGNAIDKSMLQVAGAPIVLSQFDCDEHQDALDENVLAGGPDVPDGLLGIALTPQIVGSAGAAGLDGPEIDPTDDGWIALVADKGTKGWKLDQVIDNEHVSYSSGHGR